ncbi:hypothetical protein [Microbacterium esteraromaticum]|nr:hypothetical protein [Microbacterium esteraromaticum]
MADHNGLPPLGYVPAPLEHHTVTIAFDVLARSEQEAAYIVRETLMEDLAAPGDAVVTDGDRMFGEYSGEDVSSIQSWIPVPGTEAGAVVPPPADLLVWQTLRRLAETEDGAGLAVSATERERIAELLRAVDLDVVVPDPEHPDEPAIYEGPASEAHRWIPAGSYRATSPDGDGQLRLLVGAARDGTDQAESVAFTAAAHDAAALDRIFFLLEGIGRSQAARTLEAVNAVLAFTGRPAADLDGLSTDRGWRHPLLRGLLAGRGESLDPDTEPEGPTDDHRPGLSR